MGALVLGGAVRPGLQLEWVTYSGADLYTVPLTEVSHAGGGRLGGRVGSAIVDSGTSSIEPYP